MRPARDKRYNLTSVRGKEVRFVSTEHFYSRDGGPRGRGLFCDVALEVGDVWWVNDFNDRRFVSRTLHWRQHLSRDPAERLRDEILCFVDPWSQRLVICPEPFCRFNHASADGDANCDHDQWGNSIAVKEIPPGAELVGPYDYEAVISLLWKFPQLETLLDPALLLSETFLLSPVTDSPEAMAFLRSLEPVGSPGPLCWPDSSTPQASCYSRVFNAYGVEAACGLDIVPAKSSYGITGATSPSIELLQNLSSSSITIPQQPGSGELKRLLQRAMWAEYDAECLCAEMDRRVAQGRLTLSPQFKEFERLWRRDELDHALGFAKLYAAVYGMPEKEVVAELCGRTGDFTLFEDFLSDELSICLLIAYDELATTASYSQDAVSFYPAFSYPPLITWIRRLAADEGKHYINLVNVIRSAHRSRLHECPLVLDRIVALDKQKLPYAGTFALDHDDDQFSSELLDQCRSQLLAAIER